VDRSPENTPIPAFDDGLLKNYACLRRLTHVATAARSWVCGGHRSDVRQILLQAEELGPNVVVDLGHGLFRLDRTRFGTAHLVLGIAATVRAWVRSNSRSASCSRALSVAIVSSARALSRRR
jgi:hypothetical protein